MNLMPVHHGIEPGPATRQAAREFEDQVMIRHDNRFLVATVYLDMEQTRWAVAIANNPSRHSGLQGTDTVLEVRYFYSLNKRMTMKMMRSNPMEGTAIPDGPFKDPDMFIRHVLAYERELIGSPG
jgi:hypothetical protein